MLRCILFNVCFFFIVLKNYNLFCTNFVNFFLYENIENHSWILYGKLAIS